VLRFCESARVVAKPCHKHVYTGLFLICILRADLTELSSSSYSDDSDEEERRVEERGKRADAQDRSAGRQGFRLCSNCGAWHHCRAKCLKRLLVSAHAGASAPGMWENEQEGQEGVEGKEEKQEQRKCMNAAVGSLSPESAKLPSFRCVRANNPRAARVPPRVPSRRINFGHLALDTSCRLFNLIALSVPLTLFGVARNLVESEALQVGDHVFKVTCQGRQFL